VYKSEGRCPWLTSHAPSGQRTISPRLDAARTRAFRPSHPSKSPESEPEFQPTAYGLAISERRNAARAGNDDHCGGTRAVKSGLTIRPETRRSPHRRLAVEPQGHTKAISQPDGRPPVYETNPRSDRDPALRSTKRTQGLTLTASGRLRNEPNVRP
jgi:hypothetical protein